MLTTIQLSDYILHSFTLEDYVQTVGSHNEYRLTCVHSTENLHSLRKFFWGQFGRMRNSRFDFLQESVGIFYQAVK